MQNYCDYIILYNKLQQFCTKSSKYNVTMYIFEKLVCKYSFYFYHIVIFMLLIHVLCLPFESFNIGHLYVIKYSTKMLN